VFRNDDDMLHNFVLCAPGRGQAVGAAALALGVEGRRKGMCPIRPTCFTTRRSVSPGSTDRIFFVVPTTPGDYDYICSFPGHSQLMKGVLRVSAP
jgi:azurin